ncbi:MAG TPA: response regulator [Candidatus Binatia bacterium]
MKKRVLVVDDDPAIIQVYQMALSRSFDLSVAYNGREALEAASAQTPDLVIMDVMMPEMDGLAAMAKIKENDATAKVPVILVTAQVRHKDVLSGYNSGADYYITKPFTSRELMNGINLFLGEKEA